ncbi:MAG: anthrone oxygenase family protein [Pseudomonadota bacterium]
MSPTVFLALQGVTLLYAFVGGVFLAFSDFIMRSLSRTGGSGGMEAMQVINREVFRWVFMVSFLGLAVVSLALIPLGSFAIAGPAGTFTALAGTVYLFGCFGVTVLRNVPLNERLAGMDRVEPTAQAFWTDTYLTRWTLWNTVRTMACALAATSLMAALSLAS